MNVILEGADGGGKSTLAEYLSNELSMRIQQGSGPPKSALDINDRATFYLTMEHTIFDRHPCVSQAIYGILRADSWVVDGHLIDQFYRSSPLLIYCRSVSSQRHVVKQGEDPDHIAMLTARYAELVCRYDQWALEHAHVIYRIGDNQSTLADVIRVFSC